MKSFLVRFRVVANDYQTMSAVDETIHTSLLSKLSIYNLQVTEEIDIVSAYPNTVHKARMTKMLLNSIYGKSGLKVEVELNPIISIKGMKYVNATEKGGSTLNFDITTEAAHELRVKLDIALKAAQSHGMA